MSETGKSNLLLPLGIGAGVLLLLFSMKKKQTAAAAAASATGEQKALPLVASSDAATQQIDPAPAPAYSEVASNSSDDDDDLDDDIKDDDDNTDTGANNGTPDDDDDDNTDTGSNAMSARSNSSGGGGYTPYQPSSSINTNRPSPPAPVNTVTVRRAINPNNLRLQSDQVRQAIARQKLRANSSVLRVKPKIGNNVPASNNIITAAAQLPIVIASQTAPTTPAAPVTTTQTTIFPLRFGTTSPYVKEVQRRLGVSSTGYFGTLTKAAILKRFGTTEISEALYKQIITGRPVAKAAAKHVVHTLKKAKKPVHKKIIRHK